MRGVGARTRQEPWKDSGAGPDEGERDGQPREVAEDRPRIPSERGAGPRDAAKDVAASIRADATQDYAHTEVKPYQNQKTKIKKWSVRRKCYRVR